MWKKYFRWWSSVLRNCWIRGGWGGTAGACCTCTGCNNIFNVNRAKDFQCQQCKSVTNFAFNAVLGGSQKQSLWIPMTIEHHLLRLQIMIEILKICSPYPAMATQVYELMQFRTVHIAVCFFSRSNCFKSILKYILPFRSSGSSWIIQSMIRISKQIPCGWLSYRLLCKWQYDSGCIPVLESYHSDILNGGQFLI